ncbi:MAG: TRAP transporter small permease [Clostridiales Family XIII bacterium]|jgi:TRAP-type C4-dicarboxylate transport system permease small subunit|nr:TRAP transporter small permease [Clostridiales Family XIII bacterium]
MINKFLDKASIVLLRVSSVLIWIIMAVMVINILGRAIFNLPLKGTTEIVTYGIMLAIILALGRTGFLQKHVAVTIVQDMLPPKARAILKFFTGIVSMGVFLYLTYFYFSSISSINAAGRVTEVFRFPYAIIYLIIGVGMLLATLLFLYHACVSLRPLFGKTEGDGKPKIESDTKSAEA